MNKLFLLLLLLAMACASPEKKEEIAYTPTTFAELESWAAKKAGPRYIEVEGFLSPDALISLFTLEKFAFSSHDGSHMPVEAMIMTRTEGRNCVIYSGNSISEYRFEDLKISTKDSAIIPFQEKVKLRGELKFVKNYCSIAVNEITEAGK